jgi:hypothetical protein
MAAAYTEKSNIVLTGKEPFALDVTGAAKLTTALEVSYGGTGATSLTGYVKGDGTSSFTAEATIPAGDVVLGESSGVPLITGAGGVLQAGSFGTSSGTFCEGDDSRLSDARTPTSHTHGNITNDGKIGSTANLPLITTTSGTVTTGSFGTSANTFCEGDDSRLSDARTPTSHVLATASGLGGEHTVSGLTAGQVLKAKGATSAQFEAVAFSEITGTATVAQGGSGATSLTGYLKGNGTSAFTASATIPGTDVSGDISGNAANVTGTVAVANGGTGTATGSITGTGALAFTAGGTNTNVTLAPNGTGTVDVSSKRITNLAEPTSSTDAATKGYVDAVKQGLDVKNSVRAATTANITLSGTQSIDGVSVVAEDRVLVKNQSTASENGIYVVKAGAWVRADDANSNDDVTAGMFTFVTEGTANADSGWILTTNDAITLGTTGLAFAQFSGAGQIDAGSGLTKTGNTINAVGTTDRITVDADSIDIASTYAGQATITTLGTVATGTWNASTIAVSKGGSGATSLTGYLKGNGTSAFTASATIPGTDVSGNISGNAANVTGVVAIVNGGTGAATASGARTNLELPYTFGTGGTSIVAWESGDNVASGNWSVVNGGKANTASNTYATVAGGKSNTASGIRNTVGGGQSNQASAGYSTVGGGQSNQASANWSTVGGGTSNKAAGSQSNVGGGGSNTANDAYSTVGGGYQNTASGTYSTVGGGRLNTASGSYSFVGGGGGSYNINTASGARSVVSGGGANTSSGSHSTVGGGYFNKALNISSAVGGGSLNTATNSYSAVGGGYGNTSSGSHSTVGGGYFNKALNPYSAVGGGYGNTASSYKSFVGGGSLNTASGFASTVGGGDKNIASGNYGIVGGGYFNTASSYYSTVGGGQNNSATNSYSAVGGGLSNAASGSASTVAGGTSNKATASASTVAGGKSNTASGSYSTVGGGQNNTATHSNVFLLGSSLVSDANDTTYVENLRVKGGLNTGVTLGTNAFPTGKVSIRSAIVNLKTVAETTIFTVPTGYMFLIDTMEVVTTSVTSAGTAPTVQFGNTGDSDAYYGPTLITSNAVGARHIVENPQDGATAGTAVTFGVTVASTATAHSGVGIVTGYLLKTS